MEETKQNLKRNARLHCENALCTRDKKYFCQDHKMVLCNTCHTALHLRCCTDAIADKKDVQECIDYIKNLISKIIVNSEVFKANKYIKDFDLEIKRYRDSLQSIEQKFMKAVEKDEFIEFETFRKKYNSKDFSDSQSFVDYTKYITLLETTNADELNINNRTGNTNAQHLKKYREKIAKEIEDIKQRELDQKLKEEKVKLVNETKDRIKKLEDTIAEETKSKAQLVEKTKTLEAEFKTEIKNIMDEYEQQKIKASDASQLLQPIYAAKFNEIYSKNMGSKISDLKTCSLSFDLSDSKQKAFFKEIESAKLRLPDIKRIKIDYITDGDADLNSFLNKCTPDRLELLCLNHKYVEDAGVKADFYTEALCKTLKAVTNEVYIECLKLTSSDLEQIVKASSNSERLVIRYCDVGCSAALDFATADKYNTKFLSFHNCACTSNRKSDFISAPASFENIVEALAKSELKDSLQTLDIRGCGLDKTAVLGLLSKHGMGAVSVVETGGEPME